MQTTITVTSKNQVTLPAEYVRDLHIKKARRLSVRRRGDELVLRPEPTLEERMRKHWDKLPPFKGTKTDEELKQAIRESYSRKEV